MSLASKVFGSWQGNASWVTTSMSGFFFSKAATSESKNLRSTLALLGGSQLTVMRVLPLAESSPDPQAEAVSAREQTPIAAKVRRNPVLLIGGPLWAGAVGAAHSSTADTCPQDVAQNL